MFKKFDVSLILIFLYCIRPAVFGASIADALVIGFLAGMHVYRKWAVSKEQKPVDEEVKNEIKELKNIVNTLSIARSMNRF